jgi:hypothetical protein
MKARVEKRNRGRRFGGDMFWVFFGGGMGGAEQGFGELALAGKKRGKRRGDCDGQLQSFSEGEGARTTLSSGRATKQRRVMRDHRHNNNKTQHRCLGVFG